MKDDPRLLPEADEQKLVDAMLSGRLSPDQVTARRNRLIKQHYDEPSPPQIKCPHCVRGLINNGTEGCGNCGGKGYTIVSAKILA